MNVALRAAHRDFDVGVARLLTKCRAENVPVPCASGCSACCYDVAWALEPEVDELAERVRSMPTRKRASVIARTRDWLAGMRAAGLDPDDIFPDLRTYHRAKLACPLLENGHCTVYDIRPMSCRAHYVIAPDARGCANRAEEPTITCLEIPDLINQAVVQMVGGDVTKIRALREYLLPRLLGAALGVEPMKE